MPHGRLPKLAVRERSDYEMRFNLSETDVSMANAIRRIMISEVPTMAIDLVTVMENTSPLHDEYIVHRLGLVPLKSDLVNDFEYGRDCELCEDHCPNCSVTFVLNVTAANDDSVRAVTSFDLYGPDKDVDERGASVVPVHDSGGTVEDLKKTERIECETGILIAKLTRGQRIHMMAIARKGLGKDHAKWSPMCTVAYRIVPPAVELVLDEINRHFSDDQKNELMTAAQGLLHMDETTHELTYETPFKLGRIAITPDTTRKCGELAAQAQRSASDVIKYNHKPDRFEFVAETTGALTPASALSMALEILQKKIDGLAAHQR